jgi:hypothetical protein
MIDRPNESQFTPHSGLQQQTWMEREWLGEGDSRVSTDSDLDLESDDEDDYRSTFSNLLMRKLIAIELAQQHAFRKEKLARVTPPQPNFAAPEDSYCAKMRRVSQWRESTLPSEASSEAQSGASSSGFAIVTVPRISYSQTNSRLFCVCSDVAQAISKRCLPAHRLQTRSGHDTLSCTPWIPILPACM